MIDDHDGQFDIIPVTTGPHSDLGWCEAVCTRCDENSGNNAEPFTDDWVEAHVCPPIPIASQQFDVIQKAQHYNSHPSGIEAIEVGRHLTADWFNAFKYVFRADHKNGRQDIEKAIWYAKDGTDHDIPIHASTWNFTHQQKLQQIIDAETDENRITFFRMILIGNRSAALVVAQVILESWPT